MKKPAGARSCSGTIWKAPRPRAELGYDAIELFAPAADAVDPAKLRQLLAGHGLGLAAVGTGAGMVRLKLSLTDADAQKRAEAKAFIKTIIDLGAPFGAPAIIGSMQGRSGNGVSHPKALDDLAEALEELGAHAEASGVKLIYEPLNRYETNLINTVEAGVKLMDSLKTKNVTLLADLFHMNIEEKSIPEAIMAGAGHIGHVHFVDSNRRPAGFGHMDYAPIAKALREIGYEGYASAEALPWPDSDSAAKQTIEHFRRFLASVETQTHA